MWTLARRTEQDVKRAQWIGFVVVGFVGVDARAEPFGEIPNALAITKSGNKNEVHYAVRVDGACMPSGRAPVRPYWQMLERSNDATEGLSSLEERALGIDHQAVEGDSVRFALRGMPGRLITVRTARHGDGACGAVVQMSIAGESARVSSVYVKQKLFGVDYIALSGTAADGRLVREIIKP